MLRYKLLKSLPGCKAGTIFTEMDDRCFIADSYGQIKLALGYASGNPDWFEPIPEIIMQNLGIISGEFRYRIKVDTRDKAFYFICLGIAQAGQNPVFTQRGISLDEVASKCTMEDLPVYLKKEICDELNKTIVLPKH